MAIRTPAGRSSGCGPTVVREFALKLLLLPLILVAVIVKVVLIIAFGVTLVAVLIPLMILGALFVGPFLILVAVR